MNQEKEITIYDIAKALKISTATVSRALNNHPAVANSTKKKIFEKAEALGYRFNTFASNLRSKHTKSIGILVPRLNSTFMSDAIAGIESVANREGYSVVISQSLEDGQKEIQNANMLFHNRVDGIIVSLAANTSNTNHFQPYYNKKVPVIFFDRVPFLQQCQSIIIDNYRAAFEITQHLIDSGKSKIMHISGNLLRNVYSERLRGYKDALKANGFKFSSEYHIECNLSHEDGYNIAHQIAAMPNCPDAVFAANDACAIHCMLQLKKLGFNIPEQIAIAGFNDDPMCLIAEPHLSTIKYNGYAMGEIAAKTLLHNLNGDNNTMQTQSIILRHELIIRESTKGAASQQ